MEMDIAWIDGNLGNLDFADDICLLNKTVEDRQPMTDGFANSILLCGPTEGLSVAESALGCLMAPFFTSFYEVSTVWSWSPTSSPALRRFPAL